jgi:hypothetical protein
MMPASQPLPTVMLYGCRRRVAECARCGHVRPLLERGLCNSCRTRCHDDGTITEFGYVKADRVADFARLRGNGCQVAEAGERIGVSRRTAERYEAELAGAGRAPWRQYEERRRAA